jgi:hypothetical protein
MSAIHTTNITHLSFTRLKELAHSPLALKQYIEGDKTTTAAMTAGSLLDCLLFEPEKFDERFLVMPKVDKRTKVGQAAWEAAMEACGDRQIITDSELADARFLDTCIRANSTVAFHGLLNPDFFQFQVPVEFTYGGFKHRGVKDADGTRRDGQKVIWDLKRMGSRSGEQLVRSQIRNNMYDLQAAIYSWPYDSKDESVKYYVIAVDNDGFVTPFEITRDARNRARILWNKLIKAAHVCNMENLDMGPEFWAEVDGFFLF